MSRTIYKSMPIQVSASSLAGSGICIHYLKIVQGMHPGCSVALQADTSKLRRTSKALFLQCTLEGIVPCRHCCAVSGYTGLLPAGAGSGRM